MSHTCGIVRLRRPSRSKGAAAHRAREPRDRGYEQRRHLRARRRSDRRRPCRRRPQRRCGERWPSTNRLRGPGAVALAERPSPRRKRSSACTAPGSPISSTSIASRGGFSPADSGMGPAYCMNRGTLQAGEGLHQCVDSRQVESNPLGSGLAFPGGSSGRSFAFVDEVQGPTGPAQDQAGPPSPGGRTGRDALGTPPGAAGAGGPPR